MADNYLERKYEDLQARKAKEQRARQLAWKNVWTPIGKS